MPRRQPHSCLQAACAAESRKSPPRPELVSRNRLRDEFRSAWHPADSELPSVPAADFWGSATPATTVRVRSSLEESPSPSLRSVARRDDSPQETREITAALCGRSLTQNSIPLTSRPKFNIYGDEIALELYISRKPREWACKLPHILLKTRLQIDYPGNVVLQL